MRETKIGLTVITAILLLYLTIAWSKGIHFFAEKSHFYYITFANVNGLLKSDPVTIFGYPSGSVLEIVPQKENVRVKISIAENIELQEDAKAEIQMKELMGGKLIEIKPGLSDKKLAHGATIQGYSTVDLPQTFAIFGKMANTLQPEQIEKMLSNMEKITTVLAAVSEKIPVEQMDEMMEVLQKNADDLNELLGKIPVSTLERFINNADTSFRTVNHLIQTSDDAIRRFNSISTKAEQKTLPTADSLMRSVLSLLDRTEKTMTRMEKTIEEFQKNGSIAQRALLEPQFSVSIDTTIRNLNNTLNVIKNQKLQISLGLRSTFKTMKEK